MVLDLNLATLMPLILAMTGVFIFVGLIVYIYTAFALMTVAKKLKYDKPWLAWIPVANFFLYPILADKEWYWGFIILVSFIPYIGSIILLVFLIMWMWKIFEKRKFHGALSLLMLIPVVNFVMLGLLAWYDKK